MRDQNNVCLTIPLTRGERLMQGPPLITS